MELIRATTGVVMGLLFMVQGVQNIKSGNPHGEWLVTFGVFATLLQVFA